MKNFIKSLFKKVVVTDTIQEQEQKIEIPQNFTLAKEDLEVKRNVARGLSKFYFGDQYVWALNRKVAEKKFSKLQNEQKQ